MRVFFEKLCKKLIPSVEHFIPNVGTIHPQRGNKLFPSWESMQLKTTLPHHHTDGALGSGAHILYLIVVLFVFGSLQESVKTVFGLVALF